MERVRHVHSIQNREIVIFLQEIKEKSIATDFVFHCDVRHSDILWGSSHVCCYLFLGGCGQNWELAFTPCLYMFKNSQNLLHLETQKSGVSHKWCDEWSALIE